MDVVFRVLVWATLRPLTTTLLAAFTRLVAVTPDSALSETVTEELEALLEEWST